MNTPAENPRAVVGSNQAAEHGVLVAEQMRRDYAELEETVAAQLEEARNLPVEVNDDETMGIFAKLIKRLRDTAKRAEAFHAAEKEPHLRAGQAVDSFFFALIDKCARRDRKNKPGAADILGARLDDYNQRKLAAEVARRRAEAEEAARVAAAAAAKAREEARLAEEARQAAERARKPEHIETKGQVAAAAEQAATTSAIDSQMAAGKADDAYISTLAKPSDIVRTRIESGPTVTMAQEPYAEVEDYDLLDKVKLWPFISQDAKDKAVRAWAKTTGHREQMTGAKIGKRAKSQVR